MPVRDSEVSYSSCVWAFYLDRLLELPGLLFESVLSVVGSINAVVFLILLFNRQLGSRFLRWEGVSRWWALVPIALMTCHAALQANYAVFESLSEQLRTRDRRRFSLWTRSLDG